MVQNWSKIHKQIDETTTSTWEAILASKFLTILMDFGGFWEARWEGKSCQDRSKKLCGGPWTSPGASRGARKTRESPRTSPDGPGTGVPCGPPPSAPGPGIPFIRTAPRARERVRARKVGKSYHKILSLNLIKIKFTVTPPYPPHGGPEGPEH